MDFAIDIDKLNLANLVGKVMDEIMENYQSLSIILSFLWHHKIIYILEFTFIEPVEIQ